jgi:hypothetical protein
MTIKQKIEDTINNKLINKSIVTYDDCPYIVFSGYQQRYTYAGRIFIQTLINKGFKRMKAAEYTQYIGMHGNATIFVNKSRVVKLNEIFDDDLI